MYREAICDLSECSEFRQTLQGRSPAIVHATAMLLILLLGAAVVWAALVEANLVVQAPGRVRPVEEPAQVFTAASPHLDGRVAEVCFREGEQVACGQVLLRLSTERLDNEIEQLERRIAANGNELNELDRLNQLLLNQFASAESKAKAELAQAQQESNRALLEQASQVLQATAELNKAKDRLQRSSNVLHVGAATREEIVDAETQVCLGEEKVKQAKLPVDVGRVAVLQAVLQTVNDEFGVRLAEVEIKKVAKQGDVDVATTELANLLLAREQATLRAPIDGVVVSSQIDMGDVLEPGKPVVEIAPQDGFRFEVAIPSADVGDLQVGMPVKIKFDAYDYQKYGTLDGTVCFISPDSRIANRDAEDAQATAPLAYVVRAELPDREFGHGELRGRIKLGLGGTAEIVTGRESILAIFFKKIRRTISLG